MKTARPSLWFTNHPIRLSTYRTQSDYKNLAKPLRLPDDIRRKDLIIPRYAPSKLDKLLLVWTKKYRKREDIPMLLPSEVIERTKSQVRIKCANYMIVFFLMAFIGAIMWGKEEASRGVSLASINRDWHKRYDEEQRAKEKK